MSDLGQPRGTAAKTHVFTHTRPEYTNILTHPAPTRTPDRHTRTHTLSCYSRITPRCGQMVSLRVERFSRAGENNDFGLVLHAPTGQDYVAAKGYPFERSAQKVFLANKVRLL